MTDENVDGAKPNTDAPETDQTAIFDKSTDEQVDESASQEETKAEETKAEETKTEGTKAETKDAESKKSDDGTGTVPDKYELSLPEGSLQDESVLDEMAAYARQKGLSNEEAQELLEREDSLIAQYHDDQLQDLEVQAKQWEEEVKADPELGGDNFAKTAELSARVVDKFGTPELKEILNATGAGNHIEFVKFFKKIGDMITDDTFIRSSAQGGAGKKSAEETFYPTTTSAQT